MLEEGERRPPPGGLAHLGSEAHRTRVTGIPCDAQAVGGARLVLAFDAQGQKCQALASHIIAPSSLGEGRKDESEHSVVRVGRMESLLWEPRLPLLWREQTSPPPTPPTDITVCVLIVIPTYLHLLSLNDPDVAQRPTSTLTPFLFSNDL